jgi:SAM-dependent methyltransferase
MQITRDFARRPLAGLRLVDLGCGEGVYAIEAGLRGAEVLALDARTQRTEKGAACATRHGLANVRFVQGDVRRATRETVGTFDVVYLLGLLYHLDSPDVFSVLENVYGLCAGILVVDTLVSLTAEAQVEWRDQRYEGRRCREHDDADADEVRRGPVLKSIDNTFSFRFTRSSLLRVLYAGGFTSVYECHAPFEPDKAEDRITLVALKGVPVLRPRLFVTYLRPSVAGAVMSGAPVGAPPVLEEACKRRSIRYDASDSNQEQIAARIEARFCLGSALMS